MRDRLEVGGGGDLAAVDRSLHQHAVRGGPWLDGRGVRRLGQPQVVRQHRREPRHYLELALPLLDRLRLDHRDEVAAQGPGVGQPVEIDLTALHVGDGFEDQLRLRRPPAVDGRLPRLCPQRHHVHRHALVASLGEHLEGRVEDQGVARVIALPADPRGLRALGRDESVVPDRGILGGIVVRHGGRLLVIHCLSISLYAIRASSATCKCRNCSVPHRSRARRGVVLPSPAHPSPGRVSTARAATTSRARP